LTVPTSSAATMDNFLVTHKLPVRAGVRRAIEKEEGDAVVVRLEERLS
jgi:Domain of unknown function (DUF1905)